MAKILDRISEIAAHEGITIGALERNIGASKGVLSRAIDKGTDIQAKWIVQVVENYPQYSAQWLLTGEGSMLKKDEVPGKVSYDPKVGTPYFDVDFIGGFSEIFNDQTTLPACNVLVPGFEKASVWCNVTGHSMEPKINHGDIIALRECSINDIQYGEIYAVVLDTIRTIKILRRGSCPDVLRYIPINQDFDEQEFPISRIIRVFEVLGSIARFF
ncbi:MAG: S24 family peptidase [Prevotella sp.]|nr:S24 family peptidase [Prevotella sp.]